MTKKLDELANRCGEWLRGSGPQSEIVISSRIRLARNLSQFPFIRRCNEGDRRSIERTFKEAITSVPDWQALLFVNVGDRVRVDTRTREYVSRA